MRVLGGKAVCRAEKWVGAASAASPGLCLVVDERAGKGTGEGCLSVSLMKGREEWSGCRSL